MYEVERVQAVVPENTDEVVGVLCDAFHDYPVMRHVVGPADDYDVRLEALIGFFVAARVLRGEPMLGITEGGRLVAAAIVTPPGDRKPPQELLERRDRLWQQLGPDARARYEHLGVVWQKVGVPEPNLHLNMIGVRRGQESLGRGRTLLDAVHRMAAEDSASAGVSLTTEDPTNVGLYLHCGYQIVGHESVTDELETWGFLRPDGPRP